MILNVMYERCVKRTFDFVFVVCILAIVWPILLLLAFWLYFANKGAGAFFIQERPGKHGKIFKVIKFKTMTDERDEDDNLLPDEKRLTKIGNFIRSTSIDQCAERRYGFDRSPPFTSPIPSSLFQRTGPSSCSPARHYRLGTGEWT